jgi:hypothetical protein
MECESGKKGAEAAAHSGFVEQLTEAVLPTPNMLKPVAEEPWIIEGRLRVANVHDDTIAGLGHVVNVEAELIDLVRRSGFGEADLMVRVVVPHRQDKDGDRTFRASINARERLEVATHDGLLNLGRLIAGRCGVGRVVRLTMWYHSEQDAAVGSVVGEREASDALWNAVRLAFAKFYETMPLGIAFRARECLKGTGMKPTKSVMHRVRAVLREYVGHGRLSIQQRGQRRYYAKTLAPPAKAAAGGEAE